MAEITTTNGYTVIVDDADHAWAAGISWYGQVHKGGRVYANNRSRGAMHRLLLGITDRRVHVDHKNGNGLDNRRENIRPATPSQNLQNTKRSRRNTSGYKGVSFDRRTKSFAARIMVGGKNVHLGRFKTAEEARDAYDWAVAMHRGEFGVLNV